MGRYRLGLLVFLFLGAVVVRRVFISTCDGVEVGGAAGGLEDVPS